MVIKVPIRAKLDDIENHFTEKESFNEYQRYIVNIDHITKVNSKLFIFKTLNCRYLVSIKEYFWIKWISLINSFYFPFK
jgi:hypothetical protein